MKHLTILLLAVMAGVAWGKDSTYSVDQPNPIKIVPQSVNTGQVGTPGIDYNIRTPPLRYNVITPVLYVNYGEVPITAGLLEEYLAWCCDKADTVSVHSHKSSWQDICIINADTRKCIIAKHYLKLIQPQQPSLPGLLAWIKRKYERVK